MQEELQGLITKIIKDIDARRFDDRVTLYQDYKARFVVLKPSVKVSVELTEGKVFTIDISDYFEGVAK